MSGKLYGRPKRRLSWLAARAAARTLPLMTLLMAAHTGFAQQAPDAYAHGRILVKFREQVAEFRANTVLGKIRAKGALRLGILPIEAVILPADEKETDAVNALRNQPEVEFAELDALLKPAATPNDPSYANQWFLPNISAPQAWAITTGNTNLIVAVLDSGCDPTHPGLLPNYVAGWDFYDNTSDTHDVFGHGTAVAGCVGAAGNNGIGIASVSWGSKIMPCRVTDASGNAYVSTITSGLQWAADHGARLANLSFDGVADNSSVQSAAQYFYNKGGLVVCAAGNSGTNPGYAACPYMICASATDSTNNRTSWSNYGNSECE